MYLRFSTIEWDPESTRNTGILMAAHELRDEGGLSKDEHKLLRDNLKWFNEKLAVPKILNSEEHRRALSWFKPEGKEAIQKMWELADLLKRQGIEIVIHKTKDPGIVVYEDNWQLVAKPKKGSKVPW